MSQSVIPRRRALALIGAAAGMPLLGSDDATRSAGAPPVFTWHGQALGTEAKLLLAHPDERRVRLVIERCLAEIERLERIFSLHRPQSELCRLNRDGRLDASSQDLRIVLTEAGRFAELSQGAFDPTIQPLWRLYAEHFRRHPDAAHGPDARALERALALVGHRGIGIDGAHIKFARAGMAVSVNGIAQGYITDRIADLLREAGFASVLVQLGEIYGAQPPRGRDGWRIAIPRPGQPDSSMAAFDLAHGAIATSSGAATAFDRQARHHHLLDPRTGRSAHHHASVSVMAPRALTADALSTALAVAPPAAASSILRAGGGGRALLVAADGGQRRIDA